MKEGILLLVEDNPDDVKLTARAFQKSGIANPMLVLGDGAAALDYLFGTGAYAGRAPADAPTLVILDLNLPKIDGLEVLARMRADRRTQHVPVVVLTSSKEDQHLIASYDLGANGFVRKPVAQEEFIAVVQHLGLYWLLLNEPPPPQEPPR
jgi:two-component system response regulator